VNQCVWVLALFLALAGCSLAPSYQRPVQKLPPVWEESAAVGLDAQWWRRFNDPSLDAMVLEALHHNRDLAVSMARVEQAAAAAGISRAALAPVPFIDGTAGEMWSSTRIAGAPPKGFEKSRNHDLYLGAAWELDFWGKYRNAHLGDRAKWLASEADLAGARLLVAATAAKSYFDLLNFTFQVDVAERTVLQRLQALDMQKNSEEIGFSSRADLLRAQSEVESARYNLALSRMGLDAAQSSLLVLLGRSPAEIMRKNSTASGNVLNSLPTVPVLPDGVPSALLTRRPDLRSAEQALRAAYFDVGVVRADYFPQISLTGKTGWAAEEAGDLSLGGSSSWNYGLSLRLPLDFWTTRFRELMTEARCRESVAQYEKAVQSAFRDVRNALIRQTLLADASAALERQIADLTEAVDKADDRYRNGYSNFLDVLDADRELFAAQLSWAQTRAQQLQATVDVCVALGGGWEADASTPAQVPNVVEHDLSVGGAE